jgi:hypothetical protein
MEKRGDGHLHLASSTLFLSALPPKFPSVCHWFRSPCFFRMTLPSWLPLMPLVPWFWFLPSVPRVSRCRPPGCRLQLPWVGSSDGLRRRLPPGLGCLQPDVPAVAPGRCLRPPWVGSPDELHRCVPSFQFPGRADPACVLLSLCSILVRFLEALSSCPVSPVVRLVDMFLFFLLDRSLRLFYFWFVLCFFLNFCLLCAIDFGSICIQCLHRSRVFIARACAFGCSVWTNWLLDDWIWGTLLFWCHSNICGCYGQMSMG